ncbi:MAG: DUF4188 domain-containing protein [Acidobacteria bacterium]|nr:DUF4188 domain-containing protein [Acidobacteriota bacterium]
MSRILGGAVTAAVEGSFVVFLIGLRCNGWRHVVRWWRARRAMDDMLRELRQDPASGLISYERWRGNPSLIVQYWRSFEQLEKWARARGGSHRAVWTDYGRSIGHGGGVGVWHETYVVEPGSWEAVYNNMPPIGLGRIVPPVPATGRRATASGRLRSAAAGPAQPARP